MKKYLFFLLALMLAACSSSPKVSETPEAQKFIESISGSECERAEVTDANFLIVAIDAVYSSTNFDVLASSFLDEAKAAGVKGLKGCYIVDSKTAKFQQGAVIGDRIGKAFD
jgi:starvation-inducible outer membrane lipoprotein